APLSGGGGGLTFLQLQRPRGQLQQAAAQRDGAGRDQDHPGAVFLQRRDIGAERLQPDTAQLTRGAIHQQGRTDLDYDQLRTGEDIAHRRDRFLFSAAFLARALAEWRVALGLAFALPVLAAFFFGLGASLAAFTAFFFFGTMTGLALFTTTSSSASGDLGTTGALKFTAWRSARVTGARIVTGLAALRSARRASICRAIARSTVLTPPPLTPEITCTLWPQARSSAAFFFARSFSETASTLLRATISGLCARPSP